MNNSKWRISRHGSAGFTLIEMMIAVVVIAILAAIALPSYESYIKRSNARAAGADLVALGTALENVFQRTLNYPTVTTADTDGTKAAVTGWSPAQNDNFEFTMNSGANSYTLTATGKDSMDGCTLTLTDLGVRGPSPLDAACGGLGSW